MKKIAFVLMILMLAASCSFYYSATVSGTVAVKRNASDPDEGSEGLGYVNVYLFRDEESFDKAYAIAYPESSDEESSSYEEKLEELSSLTDYHTMTSSNVNGTEAGSFSLSLNWHTSSPSGWKDYDEITVWILPYRDGYSLDMYKVQLEKRVSTRGGLSSLELFLKEN